MCIADIASVYRLQNFVIVKFSFLQKFFFYGVFRLTEMKSGFVEQRVKDKQLEQKYYR